MTQTASQALARKWRPRDFESLVGQEHVVKALSHALQTQRLHHAYLLTGTRGVGKTTIARILAKAVNCEQGISAKPCGQCRACTEIAQGRFVDLLEVDAATNTKVEEMRQLLENAVYAPTAGRYKVYVIDEVHMLSNSSFNAMLKTLEEPPGHILFILATTDPQKIPPTVLSRCLQFGLRQLAPDQIASHLTGILQQESVQFEPGALRIIAKAARGSLRDALSLTDQSIAFAAGNLTESSVRQMLGSVDQQVIVQILQLLAQRDGGGLTALTDSLAAQSAPFGALLDELAAASYRLSVATLVGGLRADDPDEAALASLQGQFQPEDLQLFYQIATHARAELHLAPEEHIGFGMALIRMMCFRPGGKGSIALPPSGSGPSPEQKPSSETGKSAGPSGGSQSGNTPRMDAGPAALSASHAALGKSPGVPPDAHFPKIDSGGVPPQLTPQTEDTVSSPRHALTASDLSSSTTSALSSNLEAKTKAMMNATQALLAIRQKTSGAAGDNGRSGSGQSVPSQHAAAAVVSRPAPAIQQEPSSPSATKRGHEPASMASQPTPVTGKPVSESGRLVAGGHEPDSAANEPATWDEAPPWDDAPPLGDLPSHQAASGPVPSQLESQQLQTESVIAQRPAPDNAQFGSVADLPGPDDWPALSQAIAATGLVRQALVQTELVGWHVQDGIPCARLVTQIKTWLNPGMPDKIEQAVSSHLGKTVRLDIQLGEVSKTASLSMQEVRRQAQEQARQSLESDPFLKELQATMGARIVEGSLRPLHSHGPADV